MKGNAGTTLTDAVLEDAEAMGLYPTPDAAVSNDGESPESWRQRQSEWKEKYSSSTSGPKAGNGAGVPLAIAAKELTRDMMYAMPMASESANRTSKRPPSTLPGAKHGRHLSVQAIELTREQQAPGVLPSLQDEKTSLGGERISQPTLVLNPRFSEALMGLPRGWLSCERLEMESYRRWWRRHSGF
mgnify:CR=1 FL=1